MTEIKNNLYVFSASGLEPGIILSSRTVCGEVCGKNLFAYLEISRSEKELFYRVSAEDSADPVMLLGRRDNAKRAVVITNFSGRGSPLYLVVEFFDGADKVIKSACEVISYRDGMKMHMSDELLKEFPIDNNTERSMDIINTLRDIFVISDHSGAYYAEPISGIISMSDAAASLIGLGIRRGACEYNGIAAAGNIFEYDFFAELIVLLAMEARRHSRNRCISVLAISLGESVAACISYEKYDSAPEYVQEYLSISADELGLPIAFFEKDGMSICGTVPFRCDHARAGVKQSGFGQFDYRDYIYELFWRLKWQNTDREE